MMPMAPLISTEQRKYNVLRAVVREYLETAEPVGSETISRKYDLGVSSATVRNDLVALEEEGFLVQPHTSAGRIPTEAGYRFYVEQFVRDAEVASRMRRRVERALEEARQREKAAMRELVHTMAKLTNESVFVSFGDRAYLTGMTNLLRKPEFRESELLYAVSDMFDQFDRVVRDVKPQREVEVLIGGENPFGQSLSAVLAPIVNEELGQGVIGIIGPQRMDYDLNVTVVRYVHDALDTKEEQ
jgi:heat-inducible transcriptional repressor